MANNIDNLGIEISAKVKSDQAKLDKLNESLVKLRSIVNENFGSIYNRLNQLSTLNLSTLKDSASGVNRLANSLNKLKSISFQGFANKTKSIIRGIEPLKSLELGNITEFYKGLNGFSNSLNKINKIDTAVAAKKILDLANAIKPLTDEMLRGKPVVVGYAQVLSKLGVKSNSTAKSVK